VKQGHWRGAGDVDPVRAHWPAGFFGQIPQLRVSYDKLEPGAPESLAAKFSAPNPQARAMAHSMGFYQREVGFIASSLMTARSVRLGVISAKLVQADLVEASACSNAVSRTLASARWCVPTLYQLRC
jgi:hypothetical protein